MSELSHPVDILILSNGPGELATWVKPVVRSLRQILGNDRALVRISVVLSPCPNASGQEAEIALSYPEVDRVQAAKWFYPFLLQGKTAEDWNWHDRGIVLFLGGDQFFTVILGKRLGYRTVIYAEWEARWHRWIDRFGVMRSEIVDRAPQQQAHKLTVVGDLMAEVATLAVDRDEMSHPVFSELIGVLPGSKPAKLAQGVPFLLAIAEQIWHDRPHARFVIPVAPTLDLQTLARFADPQQNPILPLVEGVSAQLVLPASDTERPYLETQNGLRVELWQNQTERIPVYSLLAQCDLCLTTIGANTAELGALAVPMIVVTPTQQLDAMRAWDGIPGLLANLPGVGSTVAKLINWLYLQRIGLLAWPNKWANEEIVPELVGRLQPKVVAALALDFLNHPEKLQQMRDKLRSVRGEPGAAKKLAQIVREEIETFSQ
ncbi:lipid-A-disaccharide synthase [Phormidesmis priestleyi]|uniref:lipid-A-disaccharide synthase n=1 Tax=Phormidesmis priestleyi TaxID=268141 RepID=UPI00083AAD8A|nr:lipid-A-disaccharide synthase [Phormidesmis priestleyi]